MKKKTTARGHEVGLRERAEVRLTKKPAKPVNPKSRVDAQRLFHELEVHHIELELQNEELQQAKDDLDLSLEKYTDLYDFAPVGYFTMDADGLILDMNLTGATLLGVNRSKLVRRRFQVFVASASRTAFDLFLKSIFAGHKKQVCETALLRPERPALWVDLQAMSAETGVGVSKWCRVAVIDVSARKRAEDAQKRLDELGIANRRLEAEIVRRHAVEISLKTSEQGALRSLAEARALQEQLRQLSHQFLTVEENQRKQISRELHDKICQLLVGINVHLALFSKQAVRSPKTIARTIEPLRTLVADGVNIVHRFARDLRPSALDDLGLAPALRSYIEQLPKRKGRTVCFKGPVASTGLSNDRRTVLYRVAQEALVNAAKHASASETKVTMSVKAGWVCLEIADNGKGFAQERLTFAHGKQRLGMIGMRERVEMVGGRFSVVSTPGKGTTVQAMVAVG